MIPVFQTTFGFPHGNCFAACLASILELPIADVPNFCDGDNPRWKADCLEWLRPFGLYLLSVALPDDFPADQMPAGYHVMSGKSPRGKFNHSVVGFAGKMVHDPHPSGDGIDGPITEYDFFVSLDPSELAFIARGLPAEAAS